MIAQTTSVILRLVILNSISKFVIWFISNVYRIGNPYGNSKSNTSLDAVSVLNDGGALLSRKSQSSMRSPPQKHYTNLALLRGRGSNASKEVNIHIFTYVGFNSS